MVKIRKHEQARPAIFLVKLIYLQISKWFIICNEGSMHLS